MLSQLKFVILKRSRWQIAVLAIAIFSVLAFNRGAGGEVNSATELPPLQTHVLPQFLQDRQDPSQSGDYFEQIESTPLGYLVWTQFPVTVYVEQSSSNENTAANKRFQQWTAIARQAIADWQVYFPLQEVTQRKRADIVVLRSQPEREIQFDPETGLYDIPRAIAAQTNYQFYLTEKPVTIALKMTVRVSPNFTGVSLLATIRHELGHALGIWGHSPEKSDALYFSQVGNPPDISKRDLNTLKKIYQQPTRLGWKLH